MKNRKKPGKTMKDDGRQGRDHSFEGDKGLGQESAAVRTPIRYGVFGAGMAPTKVKTPRRITRR